MTDTIRASWLKTQYVEAMTFARRSDVLNLVPISGDPPHKYIAKFDCGGLAETEAGIAVIGQHLVGIYFPEEYQRTPCDPGQVLTWLEPRNEFHPNIRAPLCCVGPIPPGMSLLNLLHQLFAMITWQKFTPLEHNALNAAACSWARANLDRLPVDPRRSMLNGDPVQSAGDNTGENGHG